VAGLTNAVAGMAWVVFEMAWPVIMMAAVVGVVVPEVPGVPGPSDLVGGVANEVAGSALDVVVEFVLGLVVDAVEAVTSALITAMESSTSISLATDLDQLSEIRAVVLGLSLALLLAFVFLSVLKSLVAGEPGPVLRALLVDVPAAIAVTTIYVAVAEVLVQVIDVASAAVQVDVPEALGKINAVLLAGTTISAASGVPAGGLLGVLFTLLYVLGAVLVWAELLIRSAMIWIIVVLAPLGYATRASAGSRQVARRTTEIGFAVIISKFGIAVAFAIGGAVIDGATNIGDPGSGAEVEVDLTGMLMGCVVVLLAAFMPWMILKAIPVMEAAVVSQGAERGPLRFTAAGIGLALGGASLARLAGTGSGAGSGTAPPPPSSPHPSPSSPFVPSGFPALGEGTTSLPVLGAREPVGPTLPPSDPPPPGLPPGFPRWPGRPLGPAPVPRRPTGGPPPSTTSVAEPEPVDVPSPLPEPLLTGTARPSRRPLPASATFVGAPVLEGAGVEVVTIGARPPVMIVRAATRPVAPLGSGPPVSTPPGRAGRGSPLGSEWIDREA
jgi:hypothetical protein